jgi:dihydrofolate reductase
MIGVIVAVSPEGAIGLHGTIPWRHPGDMKRFKRITTGTTVIMGRKTWESIGKPLKDRRNIVISRSPIAGVDVFGDLESALAACHGDVWFIGGARIYEEAMRYADRIDVTYVPDHVEHPDAVKFPVIDSAQWEAGPLLVHEDDPALKRREFVRKRS